MDNCNNNISIFKCTWSVTYKSNFFKRSLKEGFKDYLDSFELKEKKGEDEDAK